MSTKQYRGVIQAGFFFFKYHVGTVITKLLSLHSIAISLFIKLQLDYKLSSYSGSLYDFLQFQKLQNYGQPLQG